VGQAGHGDVAFHFRDFARRADQSVQQRRHAQDFTYVDDIAAGVVAAIEAQSLPMYSVVNLGNNNAEGLLD